MLMICVVLRQYWRVRKVLKFCTDYAQPHNIVFNKAKTYAVVFSTNLLKLHFQSKLYLGNISNLIKLKNGIKYFDVIQMSCRKF